MIILKFETASLKSISHKIILAHYNIILKIYFSKKEKNSNLEIKVNFHYSQNGSVLDILK